MFVLDVIESKNLRRGKIRHGASYNLSKDDVTANDEDFGLAITAVIASR